MFKHHEDLGLMELKVMLTSAGFPIPAGKEDPRVLRLLRLLSEHGVKTVLDRSVRRTGPLPIAGEVILQGGGLCNLGYPDVARPETSND